MGIAENDITGDPIRTKAPSDKYRNNYDQVFRKNPVIVWKCDNSDCDYEHSGEFMGETHLPDTDCPVCGWRDSMMEAG